MTIDEQISTDLAIVARVSRERPVALDATLRKVGALPDLPAQPSAASPSGLALLVLSRIYALRVARTSAGVAALACTVGLIVFTRYVLALDGRDPMLLVELGWVSKFWVAVVLLVPVSAVYIVSFQLALHRVQRLSVSPERGPIHLWIRRADRWATSASITGAVSVLLFFGMMQAVLGGQPLEDLFNLPGSVGRWTILLLSVAIAIAIVGAVLVAQRARAPSKAGLVSGIALAVATIVVGLRYDIGPGGDYTDYPIKLPSMLFRGCLTAIGTTGWFLIVSSIVLRARAREEREIASNRSWAAEPPHTG